MFDPQRTLPVTESVVLKWRTMLAEGQRTGHTFSQPDLMIAAIAKHHRLTVLTRDRVHFERAGVPVLDPWAA